MQHGMSRCLAPQHRACKPDLAASLSFAPRATRRCSIISTCWGAVGAPEPTRSTRATQCKAAALDDEFAADSVDSTPVAPTLASLELHPFLTLQGIINTEPVPSDAAAAVLAVFDEHKKLQYIGFSKGMEQSLRTLFTRRPDKAYFWKATYFAAVDQDAMLATREQWGEECGDLPPGNKLALERNQWQQPVEAWAIHERGRRQAAEELLPRHLALIQGRGCREALEARADLLDEGLLDFVLSAKAASQEVADAMAQHAQERMEVRTVPVVVDKQPSTFTIRFDEIMKTGGGVMMDVEILHDHRSTEHRVILGHEYYQVYGLEPQDAAAVIFELLLHKKVARQTDGLMDIIEFPINYFAGGDVEQWFPEVMERLAKAGSAPTQSNTESFWRFNKVHTYGPMAESTESLSVALQFV